MRDFPFVIIQDEHRGVAMRSRLWDKIQSVDGGELIKVSLGGWWTIGCRIFVDDALVCLGKRPGNSGSWGWHRVLKPVPTSVNLDAKARRTQRYAEKNIFFFQSKPVRFLKPHRFFPRKIHADPSMHEKQSSLLCGSPCPMRLRIARHSIDVSSSCQRD